MTIEFNPETQYVVRNDRYNYDVPEEEKPDTFNFIQEYFSGANKDLTQYSTYGENNKNVKIAYFDSEGNELGTVNYFFTHTNEGAVAIHTPDVTYYDWDCNGTIDCEDRDRVYDKGAGKYSRRHGYSDITLKSKSDSDTLEKYPLLDKKEDHEDLLEKLNNPKDFGKDYKDLLEERLVDTEELEEFEELQAQKEELQAQMEELRREKEESELIPLD